jgi:hypothetical protein
MKNTLVVLCTLLCVACTSKTALLPEATSVKVVYEKPNCKLLGKESGHKVDKWGNLSLLEIKESALNELKNKAAKLGGDTLYVMSNEKRDLSLTSWSEYLVEGEIYKCN